MTDRSAAARTGDDAGKPASAPALPTETLRTRLAAVPRPYRLGAGAAVLVLLVALGLTGLKLSSADDTGSAAAETTTSAAAAPAPSVTTVPTTASAEQDAARRTAFVQTMTRLGLTEPQANCVADKVGEQVGWAKLGVNLMEGENAKVLEALMLTCVKPG